MIVIYNYIIYIYIYLENNKISISAILRHTCTPNVSPCIGMYSRTYTCTCI